MEIAVIATGAGTLIFLSYLFTHLFRQFQIPDVLFLVVVGLILGPITGLIDVDEVGVFGNVFVMVTLLIILFEAGLSIKLRQLLSTAPRAFLLMALTLIGTVALLFPIAYFFLGLTFIESIIIGVLLGGVSGGIAVSLVEKLPVSESSKSLLTLESNLSDVFIIGTIFAIIDFSNGGVFSAVTFSTSLGMSMLIAMLIGAVTALIWSQLISKVRDIQNNIFMTPALVLMVFGVSELMGGSGILAALAFGITLGNLQFFQSHTFPFHISFQAFTLTKWEKRMFSGLVFLFKTYFFVYIGLSIGFENLPVLFAGFVATILLLMVRWGAVYSALGSSTSSFDKQILSRIFPKGLVGVALITLINNQVAQEFTYAVVLFSILLTSVLIFFVRKEPETEILPEMEVHKMQQSVTPAENA